MRERRQMCSWLLLRGDFFRVRLLAVLVYIWQQLAELGQLSAAIFSTLKQFIIPTISSFDCAQTTVSKNLQ